MNKITTIKATQTLWLSQAQAFFDGGWVSPRYHWMAWTLSCLLLKKHFKRVQLITDEAGKRILIDQLQLPYDSVELAMEQHKELISKSWVLVKLAGVASHSEPFLHVDGDLFLWECPSEEFLNSPLTAQHLEIGYPAYTLILKSLKENNFILPACMDSINHVIGINTGLLGGQEYGFFKRFFELVNQFYDQNSELLQNAPNDSSIATFTEQVLFQYQAQFEELKIKTLIKPSFKGEHSHFNDLLNVGVDENPALLTHLLGVLRQYLFSCKLMEFHLRYLFPEYHQRTNNWFDTLGFNSQEAHFEVPFSIEKHRTPEQWTHTHVEAALQHSYQRTIDLLKYWGISTNDPAAIELSDFSHYHQLSELQHRQLEDCRHYEHARKQRLEKAVIEKTLLGNEEFQRFVDYKALFKSHDAIQNLTIAPANEPLLTSRWNWHQLPSQQDSTPVTSIYDLVIDHHSLHLQEFVLEPSKTGLLLTLTEPITVEAFVQKTITNHSDYWEKRGNKAIFDTLKELYLKGFITFYKTRSLP
ncbi:DUF6734 family protein [Runella sp.]|uniref:DUF6734 family protein n=1 Tax=Runella sp. TaxID=1960881 RepID=UPI003D14E9D1